jgi:hypothetical protein
MRRDKFAKDNIFEMPLAKESVTPSPVHDGAEFITGALRATAEAPTKIRETVQGDIADTLNCRSDSLTFLWTKRIKGQATLECEIPDFRTALNDHTANPLAAE